MPDVKNVKKLHMASNLNELQEKASGEKASDKSFKDRAKRLSVENLFKSADKLFTTAKGAMTPSPANALEDEELVYTYLYRAMELYILCNSLIKDKQEDKTYYSLMYSKNTKMCMDLLEKYASNLQKRYREDKAGKETVNEMDEYTLSSSLTVKKRKGGEDREKGKVLNGNNNNSEGKSYGPEYFNIQFMSKTQEPSDDSDYYGGKKFIECQELKDLIFENPSEVLIIDIRPKTDFEDSRIVRVHNVNIQETSISAGLSAGKVGWLITNSDEQVKWASRGDYKQVVLMDWYSETKDVIPNTPLSNLMTTLSKWDPDTIYKNTPLILNGGFEKWLDMYPTLTSNPTTKRPLKPVIDQFIHLSEHYIEYPISELEDIIHPKPKAIPKSTVPEVHRPLHIPAVDRTTKPSSLKNISEVSENVLEETKRAEKTNTTTELMEEEMNESDKSEQSSNRDSPEPSVANQQPTRPATPPRPVEKTYPTTPKQTEDKGDGDKGVSFEKLKSGSTHSSGGLKRSSSSPNINKMFGDSSDDFSNRSTPLFDRSNKPKTSYNFDSYISTGGNMDTMYLTHGKKGRGLTGLKNLGNLCYMNSIMQCISNTVELTQELTRFNVDQGNTKRKVASEVSMLLKMLWQGDTRVYTCHKLKSRVGSLKAAFSTSEQQDSHEFLTILMDWLHEDLNEPSPPRLLSGADEATGEKAWGEFTTKNNSLILDLFYGQLKSTVTCTYCHKQSVLFEPFSNLSVPLPANQDSLYEKDRKYTLQECLKLYLTGETISGWVCPACKTTREATKKLDITRLPPVLIIHLKRFMTDMVGVGWCRKRMNMVDFPITEFNMKPYTHPSSELRFHSYNLYAVSNHYGSMESGHYTAYCRNYLMNKWYKFDDQDVSEMSPSDVRSSAAYILFYERADLDRKHLD